MSILLQLIEKYTASNVSIEMEIYSTGITVTIEGFNQSQSGCFKKAFWIDKSETEPDKKLTEAFNEVKGWSNS